MSVPVETSGSSQFIRLFLPAMLSMLLFASRAAGNQQPLRLAGGELSKAVRGNVLIDLESTQLHTDTTREAKELRRSFEQQSSWRWRWNPQESMVQKF